MASKAPIRWSLNPHKWLGVAFDCSLYYVRDPEHLIRVMSTSPSYLRTAADDKVKNLRDWGLPLGRRFRALKLWFLIREKGVAGLQAPLTPRSGQRAMAGRRAAADPALARACPRCRCRPYASGTSLRVDGEALGATRRVGPPHQSLGPAYLTPAILDGQWMVRVSIGALLTEREHVEALWRLMRTEAEAADTCGPIVRPTFNRPATGLTLRRPPRH